MSIRYKCVSVQSGATGTPTTVYVPEEATVADILEKVGASAVKNEIYVGGDPVSSDFVPDGDQTITLATKKYSSGSAD